MSHVLTYKLEGPATVGPVVSGEFARLIVESVGGSVVQLEHEFLSDSIGRPTKLPDSKKVGQDLFGSAKVLFSECRQIGTCNKVLVPHQTTLDRIIQTHEDVCALNDYE